MISIPDEQAWFAALLGQVVNDETRLRTHRRRFAQEVIALYSDDGFKTVEDVARLVALAWGKTYDPADETAILEHIAAHVDALRHEPPSTPKNGKPKQPALLDLPDQDTTYQE